MSKPKTGYAYFTYRNYEVIVTHGYRTALLASIGYILVVKVMSAAVTFSNPIKGQRRLAYMATATGNA